MKVKGPHSGTEKAVLAFAKARGSKRFADVQSFVHQLFSQTIFDGFMIAAQSANETSNWTDTPWNERLNPGGIGITPGKDFGYGFNNGAEAAKAMLIHHCAYTGTKVPSEWQSWIPLDPRYQAVFDAGFNGKVQDWEQYGKGYWATDPHYFEAIRDRAQAIHHFDSVVQGGTMPKIIDKYLDVAQDGFPAVTKFIRNRGGMSPKIIVLHIQEGHNWGSWEWFHQTTASSTVMIAPNGDIWRVVEEQHGPWTNGDVKNPTKKGQAIMAKFGPDPNYYTLSIETDGFTGEWPKPTAQLDSVVWQIKQWMKQYSIPLENVIRHADINHVDRVYCPGDDYYNYVLQRLIDEGLNDVVTKPVYAEAQKVLVNNKAWDGTKDVTVNGILFHADARKVTAAKAGAVHVYAATDSATTRDHLNVGESFSVLGWVNGEKVGDEKRWWITKYFSRVWVGNTQEKPEEVSGEELPDKLPNGVQIHNGRVYYPTLENGKERKVTVAKDTPLYKSATTRSVKVGTFKKGTEKVVKYYTFGDEVEDETMWWVLDASDPITQGARLPVSVTFERPE